MGQLSLTPWKRSLIDMANNMPIIVTGCQRSGTTLLSHALADALGFAHMEEFDFLPENHGLEKLEMLVAMGAGDVVIQAPFALNLYKEIYCRVPEVHFVGITRNRDDIYNSLKRILWCRNDYDKDEEDCWEEYLDAHIDAMLNRWDELKLLIPPCQWDEISYESLDNHPYFIPQDLRKDFTVKQWQLDKPCGMATWEDNEKCIEDKIKELSRT